MQKTSKKIIRRRRATRKLQGKFKRQQIKTRNSSIDGWRSWHGEGQ
jgi:hypothetical protein